MSMTVESDEEDDSPNVDIGSVIYGDQFDGACCANRRRKLWLLMEDPSSSTGAKVRQLLKVGFNILAGTQKWLKVLYSVYRRICDEDDELAEVTPEAVPDEVREWLAATFTRQSVATKREKPKFKSVANAIRTGIFFDKMFRKTQISLAPLPPEIATLMKLVFVYWFCRRICDEDDELAEVTPEAVPDEVREWLAATFTRQSVATKREKPKFKSVANAIRTGIFFDK
ncbi:unnamed protein product [Gongylonema pulchrum]|uniref:3'5'-cyclic nucleotide phosphodiesterase N-terminal domain-containing protein n=1 Tax=Gongylonema pulchrum TaxID=637853 RepID=A0A183DTT5_9BILA|nr:unnamed protein product [Gongylonema pulchrum]